MSGGSPGRVLVIGAGLSGLRCADLLARRGFEVEIFEATDRVGGRVRTDEVDGFRLDRGFQVLLTSYPEAREALDLIEVRRHIADRAVHLRNADAKVLLHHKSGLPECGQWR